MKKDSSKSIYPYHKKLKIENITVFESVDLEFVPGINAFIGENGTGKTHLIKSLYVWQTMSRKQYGIESSNDYNSVYQVDLLSDLIRKKPNSNFPAYFRGHFHETEWSHEFFADTRFNSASLRFSQNPIPADSVLPVFIPAIDMMGHTKGFVQTYDNYKIDFDLTHREIVSLLLSPEKRSIDSSMQALLKPLYEILGGELKLEGERFVVETEHGPIPMPSLGEGLRKIATLIRLILGGWIQPGTVLFWDEPEVNLNPQVMDEVVGALLALADQGVQIFLATHSYVILKELDIQSQGRNIPVRYFSMYSKNGATEVNSTDEFSQLEPNPILDQYTDLYDRELMRATRRTIKIDR